MSKETLINYKAAELTPIILNFDDESIIIEFNASDVFILTDIESIRKKVKELGISQGKQDLSTMSEMLESFEKVFDRIFDKEGVTRKISRISGEIGMSTFKPFLDILDIVANKIKENDENTAEEFESSQKEEKKKIAELAEEKAKTIEKSD